jgi:hypothetical protein
MKNRLDYPICHLGSMSGTKVRVLHSPPSQQSSEASTLQRLQSATRTGLLPNLGFSQNSSRSPAILLLASINKNAGWWVAWGGSQLSWNICRAKTRQERWRCYLRKSTKFESDPGILLVKLLRFESNACSFRRFPGHLDSIVVEVQKNQVWEILSDSVGNRPHSVGTLQRKFL